MSKGETAIDLKEKSHLFLGLMSGSSNDGADIALICVEPKSSKIKIVAQQCFDYTAQYYELFKSLKKAQSIENLIKLEHFVSVFFSQCINQFLKTYHFSPKQCLATGVHGPTIYHNTQNTYPFSKQLGNPGWIAQKTGITTIGDFRIQLIAQGAEGAPLAPIFHQALFQNVQKPVMILNIGGIANMTYLNKKNAFGFDVGPGNALLNQWAQKCIQQPFDDKGSWAKSGKINQALLKELKHYASTQSVPQKSIGPEIFKIELLELEKHRLPNQDVQATLVELSAISIAESIKNNTHHQNAQNLYVCGGGVYNQYLIQRISLHLPNILIQSTNALNLHPMYIEAAGFAYLAYQNIMKEKYPLNEQTAQLGGVYY